MDNQLFANTSGKLSIYIIAVIFFFTSALHAQTPNTMLEVEGEISANGVILGTTNGNAPGSMRFNPTNNRFEGYNGSEWLPLDFGEGQQAWTDSLSYIYRQTSRVGIGTATPDSSALLDLSSDAKGFLLPRMTTSQRNAITLPAQGLQIYNTDDGCLDIHIDTSWLKNCATSITYDSTKIWRQKTDVGGNGRLLAVGFSIGGKGYIGTGFSGSADLKDFWEFDPLTDVWTRKADFGGSARQASVGFSIGGKGYIGTGFGGSGNLKDFWEYDPLTDVWTQKADFGGSARISSVGFSIGGKGYIGTGFGTSGDLKDFWEYDPLTDVWTQKADFGGGVRNSSVGFSIGGKGYIGTGFGGSGVLKDFWEYDPIADVWTQKTNFGGSARYYSVGFSISGKGYVGTGFSIFGSLKDFWEYDPMTDTWTQKTDFGGSARHYSVGFSIGDKGYIGTGDGVSGISKDFWEYDFRSLAPIGGYLPADGPIAFNGIPKWNGTALTSSSITDNGINVGIGETAPDGKLTVLDDKQNAITLKTSDNAQNNGIAFQNSLNGYTWNIFRDNVGGNLADFVISGGNANADLNLLTPRFRITKDGDIGIGKLPATKLDVEGTITATGGSSTNWNTAFGWGDHNTQGYLTTFSETDPVFIASPAGGILASHVSDWNMAFGWGDHGLAGYLTSFSELDPKVGSNVINKIPKWNGTSLVNGLISDNGTDIQLNTSASGGKLIITDDKKSSITFRTPDNLMNNGIAFQNSGGAYTWNIFREDFGSNQASLIVAGGDGNANIDLLTKRFQITPAGDIGIGKIPTAKLDVDGTIKATDLQLTQKPVVHASNPALINVPDNSLNLDLTAYTGILKVIPGDIISINGFFVHRFEVGKSGYDPSNYKVFVEGSNGCTSFSAESIEDYAPGESASDHDNWMPLSYTKVFVASCTGDYRFKIQISDAGGDDPAEVRDRSLVVRKN